MCSTYTAHKKLTQHECCKHLSDIQSFTCLDTQLCISANKFSIAICPLHTAEPYLYKLKTCAKFSNWYILSHSPSFTFCRIIRKKFPIFFSRNIPLEKITMLLVALYNRMLFNHGNFCLVCNNSVMMGPLQDTRRPTLIEIQGEKETVNGKLLKYGGNFWSLIKTLPFMKMKHKNNTTIFLCGMGFHSYGAAFVISLCIFKIYKLCQ